MADRTDSTSDRPSGGVAGRTADEAARRKALTAAGIGIGIGSAALAAALIYGRSARRRDEDVPPRTSTAPKTPVQQGERYTD